MSACRQGSGPDSGIAVEPFSAGALCPRKGHKSHCAWDIKTPPPALVPGEGRLAPEKAVPVPTMLLHHDHPDPLSESSVDHRPGRWICVLQDYWHLADPPTPITRPCLLNVDGISLTTRNVQPVRAVRRCAGRPPPEAPEPPATRPRLPPVHP